MTSIFLEYEEQRNTKIYGENLIGKQFYWHKNVYGDELEFSKLNVIKVTDITREYSITQKIVIIVKYEYVYGGNTRSSISLDKFLEYTEPYEDTFPTVPTSSQID